MPIKKDKTGKWLCRIDRKDFKRVSRSFETKKEADDFETLYLANPANKLNIPESSNGQASVKQDSRRLLDLIELWYQYHGVNLADGERRRAKLEAMAVELKNPKGEKLSSEDFVAWRYQKLQKGWSKKTCNNLLCYLKALFSKLHKLKVIAYPNPMHGVEAIKLQEVEMAYLSPEQITALFSAIEKSKNPSTYYVAEICIRTGARWSEAERLKARQLQDGMIVFSNTKSKKLRYVPLDNVFYQELCTFAKGKANDDRVFENCMMAFRGAVKRAGIVLPRGQASHVLRHTFASYFIMNGGNILTLQKILGHATISQTMRYAHLAPEYFADAVKLNPLNCTPQKLR